MPASIHFSPQQAFKAVETMVETWSLTYSHHIQLVSDGGNDGIVCAVLFSKPTASVPIPPQMAAVTVTVVPQAVGPPAMTYALECEMMQRPSTERLEAKLLDKLIARKVIAEDRARVHRETGSLPAPVVAGSR